MQISTSPDNVPFQQLIAGVLKIESQTIHDEEWIHFLQDYRELIQAKSTVYALDEKTMLRYQYRIRDFLRHECSRILGMEQAFRVVNRLHNDQDFNQSLTEVLIPNDLYINELRRTFHTVKARQRLEFK